MTTGDFIADLDAAADVVALADRVVSTGVAHLGAHGGPDAMQTVAYDVAHAASAVATAKALLPYATLGATEAAITCAFIADAVHDLITRIAGRESLWGLEVAPLRDAHPFLETYRAPAFVASLAETPGRRNLPDDFELVQDTFRAFGDKVVAPRAEHVHRHNEDVPEEVISGLAEIGAFGLSVPAEYGGYGYAEGLEGQISRWPRRCPGGRAAWLRWRRPVGGSPSRAGASL